MSHIEELRKMVELLEKIHEETKATLKKADPEIPPYKWQDSLGRYILLDSLTAIVNARSVLVRAGLR